MFYLSQLTFIDSELMKITIYTCEVVDVTKHARIRVHKLQLNKHLVAILKYLSRKLTYAKC